MPNTIRSVLLSFGILFGSSLTISQVAKADVIPLANYQVHAETSDATTIYLNNDIYGNFATAPVGIGGPDATCDINNSCVIYEVNPTPVPQLYGYASTSLNVPHTVGADARLSLELGYSFEIVGPPGTAVPLIVSASGVVSSGSIDIGQFGDSVGTAILNIGMSNITGDLVQEYISGCSSGPYASGGNFCAGSNFPSSFSGNYNITVPSDVIGYIDLRLDLGSSLGGGVISGVIDPAISIDPSFSDASEFSLILSPYIGNGPVNNVPEPNSLLIFIIGLIGLALSLWCFSHRFGPR